MKKRSIFYISIYNSTVYWHWKKISKVGNTERIVPFHIFHCKCTAWFRWYAFRNLTIWAYYRDYFPIELVKTAELPANKNYIFCAYPHGIISAATFLNFQSNANNFDKLFPGIDPHIVVLNANFRVPIAKDIYLACGKNEFVIIML